jgi:hypothetical protein
MTHQGIVSELEAVFLPLFEHLKDLLSVQYPAYSFHIWSSATGSLTSYQGHDLGIECVFPEAKPQESNCVAASIGVWHLTTSPEICDFGVGWCAGASPEVSGDLLERPLPYSRENAEALAERFPELEDLFLSAVTAWPVDDGRA